MFSMSEPSVLARYKSTQKFRFKQYDADRYCFRKGTWIDASQGATHSSSHALFDNGLCTPRPWIVKICFISPSSLVNLSRPHS